MEFIHKLYHFNMVQNSIQNHTLHFIALSPCSLLFWINFSVFAIHDFDTF